MNSLREISQFVGSNHYDLRSIGLLVTPAHETISMRAVIDRLQRLPPFTLEASIDNAQGEVPLLSTVVLKPSPGVVLETHGRILGQNGTVVWEWVWSGPSTSYNFATVGAYVYEVTRTGVTSSGHAVLTRDFPITVRAHPAPPPPVIPPTIEVQANGDGSFVITGSKFTPSATVHIRVVDDALTTIWFDQSADAHGALNYRTGKICRLPGALHISANDGRADPHDHTGTLWSNTATTTCS
jgi:hypothetical protein